MTEQENDIFQDNIDSYTDYLGFSFEDLFLLSKHDRRVFQELYYNRTTEIANFKEIAKYIHATSVNLLVLGKAGVGKSNFIYRLFFDQKLLEEYKIYPIMVDYREVNPTSKEGCFMTFIEDVEKYFDKIHHPINGLQNNIEQNIPTNINIIQRHLKSLEQVNVDLHLVVFLDDLDYIEEVNLFELLEVFSPFAQSPKVSLITSARPALYSSINNNDFKYSHLFTRNVKKIELNGLNINNLISKRLAPILVHNQKHPFTSYIKTLLNRECAFQKVLKKFGIKNLDSLQKFNYPLTVDFVNFMQQITSGNLREIFDIAFDALLFILENYNKLETIVEVEEGVELKKKVLSHSDIMTLYYDNENSRFKIINIHLQKSKSKNSLLYNVLEAVKIFEVIDVRFYSILEKLGHKKQNVNWALSHLELKINRLIIPKNLFQHRLKKTIAFYPHYIITEKGDFYLTEVTKWSEYIERCGVSENSLINQINKTM